MLASLILAAGLLSSPKQLEVRNGTAEKATHDGRDAIRLVPPKGMEDADGDMLAVVPGTDFEDGTIELDVSGAPQGKPSPGKKGFIGVAFRVQRGGAECEMFYIRPVNGRIEDQAMRNHSAQYVASSDVASKAFGWRKLREEHPWVYESYVDLEVGKWTHLKVTVAGDKAKLYVNGASQPTLVVNDLKHGKSRGAVGLWAHDTTEAYFANLQVH